MWINAFSTRRPTSVAPRRLQRCSRQAGSFLRPLPFVMALAIGLIGAAALTPTPAAAGYWGFYGYGGPGFYRPIGHYRRFYPRGYYVVRPGYRVGPYWRGRWRRRWGGPYYWGGYRRALSGAEAAVITAGILGGVVLIDRAIQESARRRAYEEAWYDRRPTRYGWSGDPRFLEEERRQLEADRRAFERERRRFEEERRAYERARRRGDDAAIPPPSARPSGDVSEEALPPARPYNFEADPDAPEDDVFGEPFEDGLDSELLGGEERAQLRAAFDDCARQTRNAAAAEGLMVALPAEPAEVGAVGDDAWFMRAAFTAQDRNGDSYRRLMNCEADVRGVRYLEIA